MTWGVLPRGSRGSLVLLVLTEGKKCLGLAAVKVWGDEDDDKDDDEEEGAFTCLLDSVTARGAAAGFELKGNSLGDRGDGTWDCCSRRTWLWSCWS